jgi:signal transduction histidine kinase
VRSGDRFVSGETVEAGSSTAGAPALRWVRGIPRSGRVTVERGGKTVPLEVRPAAPPWPVRIAWSVLGLINAGLVLLALALFWQRPRDGRAVLLGLVLLAAPVFAFPREVAGRLLVLALAAHFFAVFPAGPTPPESRRFWRRFRAALRIYGPLVFFGIVAGGMRDQGNGGGAAALTDLLAIGYAGYGLLKVLSRRRRDDIDPRLVRTLTLAAGAILAAVLLGLSRKPWLIGGEFVPANLLPAILFAGAVSHLVFRLRALEVRVMARRTLQYLLARWTLGTLFAIPMFLLIWNIAQLSATNGRVGPPQVLPYLLWMFIAALLVGKRQQVLQNLDRRFFRDIDATRQALIRLAHDLGDQTEAQAVIQTLERGVWQALHPCPARFAGPDGVPDKDTVLSVPVHRGDDVLGYLHLGSKESEQPYTTEERELLEAACVQAAVALENARLSGALLARQRVELAARTSGVLAGAEEERRRLAADLHDQVLPELRQIAGQVDRLKRGANGLAPEMERLEQDVRGTMDSVREVMEALRPSALDMLGLSAALESYFRSGALRCDPPVAVSVRRRGEEPHLAPDRSLTLYRICQEAINNALKHSGAGRAGLEMANEEGRLLIRIWDDGRGFDPDAAGAGHGLANIRYRADLIGAAVRWSARDEGGTEVLVQLPP